VCVCVCVCGVCVGVCACVCINVCKSREYENVIQGEREDRDRKIDKRRKLGGEEVYVCMCKSKE
jgi:hypothetical protein